jgi:hypothetical protein
VQGQLEATPEERQARPGQRLRRGDALGVDLDPHDLDVRPDGA